MNASRCGAGPITVGATLVNGDQIDWYSAATGTTAPFKQGSPTLDTSLTTANRIFYAAAKNNTTGCVSSTRATVTATFNALATPVTTVVNGARCGAGTVVLSATAPTGTTLEWYADSSLTSNLLATGLRDTTDVIDVTTSEFVVSKTSLGCYAPSMKRVIATVNAVPSAPSASGAARCSTGTVILTATAPAGGSVAWYAAASGGTSLSALASYTTASIASTTTYYVEAKTSTAAGACISASRTEVIATVNANPNVPTAVNASRCGAGSIQVGATPTTAGSVIDWYSAATGTTAPFKQGSATLDTSLATATRIFYAGARVSATGCVSTTRATVTATFVAAAPTAASTGITAVLVSDVCGARVYRYTATPVANATSYTWSFNTGTPLGFSAVIDTGAGTNVIKVRYTSNAAAGTLDSVKVRGVNACGQGPTKGLKLTLTGCALLTAKTTTPSSETIGTSESMNVRVYPNPTTSNFNMQVVTAGKESVRVRILDVQGRQLETMIVKPNETLRIGDALKSGAYFIEVKQGKQIQTTRVLKF